MSGSGIELDPESPFEAALIGMVETYRRKRADYAVDGEWDSNFAFTSETLGMGGAGFGPVESAYFNVLQKVARLKSLRLNGRMEDVRNESVEDTYLDLAVYAVLTLALHRDAMTASRTD